MRSAALSAVVLMLTLFLANSLLRDRFSERMTEQGDYRVPVGKRPVAARVLRGGDLS
jgi:hypothetical protein